MASYTQRPYCSPNRPVSLNGGVRRPSWFDIQHLPPYPIEFDEANITESIRNIEQIILTEVHNGRDPRRIFLVGFSQGAALSLMTGLTTLQDIGGIASLSGWIPHRIRDVRYSTPSKSIPSVDIYSPLANRAERAFSTNILGARQCRHGNSFAVCT